MSRSRRWTVLFHRRAERTLTKIYVEARDRAAVTEAMAELERDLATDPRAVGESRQPAPEDATPDLEPRIVFAGPLTVRVIVRPPDRTVTVTRLARTRPGPTERRD